MATASNNGNIHFFFDRVPPLLKNRKKLRRFLGSLIRKEGTGRKLSSLNVIFCTDQALLKVNVQYLHHDFYTDVVSFDLADSAKEIIGEIYVSIDRVKDNSRRFGKSITRELHRVIFHGVLHLCGYKDKTPREQELMGRKEDIYLDIYFGRFT
jgi:rRNA maturation RNase YbeY